MGIGEFARRSRVSAKALRRYDELGLLPPARIDPGSGYRWYSAGQLDRARLVAALRQVGVPLGDRRHPGQRLHRHDLRQARQLT
jgi:protein phosphatase